MPTKNEIRIYTGGLKNMKTNGKYSQVDSIQAKYVAIAECLIKYENSLDVIFFKNLDKSFSSVFAIIANYENHVLTMLKRFKIEPKKKILYEEELNKIQGLRDKVNKAKEKLIRYI